jgi:hypothetical protein
MKNINLSRLYGTKKKKKKKKLVFGVLKVASLN